MTASLFHFSYHKCLTVYLRRVMKRVFARPTFHGWESGYDHCASDVDKFERLRDVRTMVSLNNHFVDPKSLPDDFRATRFIRDPRDLLVSGYFYHRRAAEAWCEVVDPTGEDWRVVNGRVPQGIPAGKSYAEHLQALPLEEGLLAEMDFRAAHFESMLQWPLEDERILLLTYDEVMADEERAFERIFEHYRLNRARRVIGMRYARRMAIGGAQTQSTHVRDPSRGQWRDTLPPSIVTEFERRHGGLLEMYGFDRDDFRRSSRVS